MTPTDPWKDHPSVEAVVSDYGKNVKAILDRITAALIDPNVTKEDDRTAMRIHLSGIIMHGRNWLTHEQRRKGIRKFQDLLQKALDHRDSFSVPEIGMNGNEVMDYPLQRLFNGAPPEDPTHMPFPKGPMDYVKQMLMTCDLILGEKEPKRYPRRKLIYDTLHAWALHTGQTIPPTSFIPSKRERKKTTPPYRLCGLILEAVEGSHPGDFSAIYNKIAQSRKDWALLR